MSASETIRYVSNGEDAPLLSDGGGGDADTVIKSPPVPSSEASEPKNTISEAPQEDVSEQASISEKASALKEHDVPDEESAEAEKLQNTLEKELEENDGWLKILGNDEIMKKVGVWIEVYPFGFLLKVIDNGKTKAIKPGLPETRPLRGEICTIRIEGRLQSDESVIFESNEKFVFQLGDVEVITGLDMAIPLMCKKEVAIIKVSPRFAFGTKGCPPHVPPNAHLIYEVELIDFETEKDLAELTVKERREIGNKKRERGNWWYTRGEVSLSIQCYRRALEFLDEAEGGIQYPSGNQSDTFKVSDELRELFDDRIKTLNNMAQAQLKLQAYEPALNSVDAVLKCQPKNVKALFRKGKILGEKGSTEDALKILRTASSLEPDNKAIQQEIAQLTQRQKKEHHSEKLLYKRMFKDSKDKSTDSNSTKNDTSSPYKSALTMGLVLTGVAVAAAGILTYRYRFV